MYTQLQLNRKTTKWFIKKQWFEWSAFFIHHVTEVRTTLEWIAWKYQSQFCGFMKSIIKNYTLSSLLKRWWISVWWILVKTFKMAIKYKSFKPIRSTIKSIKVFFRDLWDTLRLRKINQEKRVVKNDEFLKINW